MSSFQDPETYRYILDKLQIGVSVLDLEKKIVFWSDGAEQITGYSRIDVVGHSCTENIFVRCNEVYLRLKITLPSLRLPKPTLYNPHSILIQELLS